MEEDTTKLCDCGSGKKSEECCAKPEETTETTEATETPDAE